MRTAYGLTGPIGSGKTYIGKQLAACGCALYNADERAKDLLERSSELRTSIVSLLGQESFKATGVYNREYVARQIFSKPSLRIALEKLIHPAVFSDFEKWKECCTTAYPFVFMESALLPRLDWKTHFRGILVVTAPQNVRLARVMQRDRTTQAQAEERMQAQPKEAEYYAISHFVIENSPRFSLESQIVQLLEILKLQHAN